MRVLGEIAGTDHGIVADHGLVFLYVAEQEIGIDKYFAGPDKGDAD
ncbi:MAG: hypothetical protein ACE5NG_05805 [bacterium]